MSFRAVRGRGGCRPLLKSGSPRAGRGGGMVCGSLVFILVVGDGVNEVVAMFDEITGGVVDEGVAVLAPVC